MTNKTQVLEKRKGEIDRCPGCARKCLALVFNEPAEAKNIHTYDDKEIKEKQGLINTRAILEKLESLAKDHANGWVNVEFSKNKDRDIQLELSVPGSVGGKKGNLPFGIKTEKLGDFFIRKIIKVGGVFDLEEQHQKEQEDGSYENITDHRRTNNLSEIYKVLEEGFCSGSFFLAESEEAATKLIQEGLNSYLAHQIKESKQSKN